MKKERMRTIMQLVNSYYIAETIYEMRGERKIVSDTDYIFNEKWKLNVKDKRILDLYDRIIKIARKNPKIIAIVKVGFEDIENLNFKDSPSVSSNQKDNKNIRNIATMNQLELLKKINLKDHTLNVVEQIVKKTEKNEIYGIGQIIIACLFHDFGKSKEVRKIVTPDAVSENSSNYKPHAEVSGMYVKDIIIEKAQQELLANNENSSITETINSIADLVSNHHNSSGRWKQKVELINEADSLARKKEIEEIV